MSSIVDQFRMATLKQNRWATAAGFLIGGFVPTATFFLVHYGVSKQPWLWLIVAGGLTFSAKTVYEWGTTAFQSGWKAFGFCLLVEGVMTFSPANLIYLSIAGLGMLGLINGVATGCNLALNRKAEAAERKAREPRPAKEPAPVRAPRARVPRRKSIRLEQPKRKRGRPRKAA